MARWLRTFLIISVVAILNIVGFMYMTGYSFILWGTPVDRSPINKLKVPSNVMDNDVFNILRHPEVKDISKHTLSEHNIDFGGVYPNISKSQNQFPLKQQSYKSRINVQTPQNKIDKVLNKSENQLQSEQPNTANNNNLYVKIQLADQQPDNQQQQRQQPGKQQQEQQPVFQQQQGQLQGQQMLQQQGQQQQDNAINTQLSSQANQQLNVKINPELAKQVDKMKKEMEAHQAMAHQQQNTQQNKLQQTDLQQQPVPQPLEKFVDPTILKDIVSKAKPPNTNKVFPHDYKLVINEPNTCKKPDGSANDVFLLVVISTIHKNFEQRRAIRATWGSIKDVDGKRVVTMFLLAKNSDEKLNKVVLQESAQHHDLLMEDFVDTYKNLTLKTIMGTKWASINCPQANFVMKTDDDMYINYESLVRYLASPSTPTQNHVAGFVIKGSPIRDPKSKWYMPRETYPGNKYPPFCSGTGYVMSGDVALKVYAISEYTPFLYLEDVFFAICLEKLDIVPVKHKEFNNWRTAYSYCRFRRIISTHMVTPIEMNRIWKDQHSKKGFKC